MSTNAHNFPARVPIPVEPLTPFVAGVRKKAALGSRPMHKISLEVPKVGLSDICLLYTSRCV